MVTTFFSTQDATIYESFPRFNTGLDQILQLQKFKRVENFTSSYLESRILMKFDTNEINTFLLDNNINIDSASFTLKVFTAAESELPFNYTVEIKSASGSWQNGSGRYYGQEISDGVTWDSINGVSSSVWDTSTADKSYFSEVSGGGNWYTSSFTSSVFNYKDKSDLAVNVTPIIKNWINNTIVNDGFLIKFESSSFLQESFPATNITYYSSNTNTVYGPQLQLSWDTGSYSSSLAAMTFRDNPILYITNLKAEYLENTKHRIYLGTRPKYPRPTFTQTNQFASTKILPQTSYYQIVDAYTMEIVVPYSNYTKISGDNTGSYFDFWTTLLYPERFYKFEFKVQYTDTTEYYNSNDFIFKVI